MYAELYPTLRKLDTFHSFRIIVNLEMLVTCWEGSLGGFGDGACWYGGYSVESPIHNFYIHDHTPKFYLKYYKYNKSFVWNKETLSELLDKYNLWSRKVSLQDWRHSIHNTYEVWTGNK